MKPSQIKGYFLPGLPHILLKPESHPSWSAIRDAYERVQEEIYDFGAELIVIYSTYWPSILGHQIQALPNPKFTHVDDEFHDLGSIKYSFKMDTEFSKKYCEKAQQRGLDARTVAYEGFPIDTGSVVALKILTPNSEIPASIVSSNIYSDRSETIVLAKACRDAIEEYGKKTVVISISSLSNRLFTNWSDIKNNSQISSLKDEEWNQKFLEFLGQGRLEDASQLSRQFHKEARVNKVNNFKPVWWLAGVMGQTNKYKGKVFEYKPMLGTGAAVIGLTPCEFAAKDFEFDEDDPNSFYGDRNVLGSSPEDQQNEEGIMQFDSNSLGES